MNLSSPLVSIVINNYNYENYVGECIESCLAQTYENIEIICVDDGSLDHSWDRISSYKDKIITETRPNRGQTSAVNDGFYLSSGDIIIFLDSDDRLLPNAAACLAEMWKPELSMVHGPMEMIDQYGKRLNRRLPDRPLPEGDLLSQLLKNGGMPMSPMSGNAFSRTYAEKILPLPETIDFLNPDIFLCQCAPLYGHVALLSAPIAEYRYHEFSKGKVVKGGIADLNKFYNNLRSELSLYYMIKKISTYKKLKLEAKEVLNRPYFVKKCLVFVSIDKKRSNFYSISLLNQRKLKIYKHLIRCIYEADMNSIKKVMYSIWGIFLCILPRFLIRIFFISLGAPSYRIRKYKILVFAARVRTVLSRR